MSTALIRRSVMRSGGRKDYQDSEVPADEITIGAGPDNALQIPDPTIDERHASIRTRRGEISVRALGSKLVVVNGRGVKSSVLAVGDRLGLGSYTIEVLEAPSGFAVALLVEQTGPASEQDWGQRFVTSLEAAGLRKRRATWVVVIVVVAATLVVPMAGSLTRKAGLLGPDAPVAERMWLSGELSGAHELVAGGDCLSCHQVPFLQVKDTACLDCHEDIASHARETLAEGETCATGGDSMVETCAVRNWMHVNDMQTGRCGACHREHNEPSMLVDRSSGNCVDCHNVQADFERGGDPLAVVEGFSPETHPGFEVTLPVGDDDPTSDSFRLIVAGVGESAEQSNLTFSHVQHLDEEQVRDAGGSGALQCANCHEPDGNGEHFKPVKMLTHCEQCHELTFDEDEPLRRLPHGDAPEAVRVIREHFLSKYVEPRATSAFEFERRPMPDGERMSVACTASALSCAQSAFNRVFSEQLQQTDEGCAKCHKVVDLQAAEPEMRYAIRTVRMPRDFMPAEHFPHDQHRILSDPAGSEDQTGDAACLTCHAATKSEKSSDVLMPGEGTCFACHRDETASSRVSLYCADCHGYHPRSGLGRSMTDTRSNLQ